jgi:hypothetical protein
MGLLYFHSANKLSFAVHFEHPSFWPSADVKPLSNDKCLICFINIYSTISGFKGFVVLSLAGRASLIFEGKVRSLAIELSVTVSTATAAAPSILAEN